MNAPGRVELVVDTNTFIQLRDVQDLPWRELVGPASAVDLIVARGVIDELDGMRIGSNRRLRDRARAALQLILEASTSEARRHVLKQDRGYVLSLVLDDTIVDWDLYPRLDRGRVDDEVVAVALTRAKQGACGFFSHDVAPTVRARQFGLEALQPPETWLLPAQEDDQAKKIRGLEKQLAEFRAAEPLVQLEVLEADDMPATRLVFRVPELPHLTEDIVARLTVAYLAAHPAEPGSGFAWSASSYRDMDGAEYASDYANFRREVASSFADLAGAMIRAGFGGHLRIRLRNEGRRTAERLRLEIRVPMDCGMMVDPRRMQQRGEGIVSLPRKPAPPQSPFAQHSLVTPAKDPTTSYWQDRPDLGVSRGSLICAEFRPQAESIRGVVVRPAQVAGYEGIATLHVSAANLPAPIRRDVPFAFAGARANWTDADVLRLLPGEIHGVLLAAAEAGELDGLPWEQPAPRTLVQRLGLEP